MIFYFHGFASSGRSWKVEELKKQLPAGNVTAPTLPVDPDEVKRLFEESAADGLPDLLVGSSLGGFYAYYFALRFGVPAVLINPSITPWETLKGYVGEHKRYYTDESFEWKESYPGKLKALRKEIDGRESRHGLLHFYLSRDDEVLDLSVIPRQFPGAGSIHYFENCGHSFTRFPEIIPHIRALLEKEGQYC
ncbi:MAG: alpha/beta fold hydrolase [bacterium]|nr:alpha/beta fold hydrolase [bacterium]